MDAALLTQLLTSHWMIDQPTQVQALTSGTNNQVLLVATALRSYVLRLLPVSSDPTRLHFEQSVLQHLAGLALPFAVPTPLLTRTGERVARVQTAAGEMLAVLTDHIEGRHPDHDNLPQATAAGQALALLDGALAHAPTLLVSAGITWRSSGDLAHCHPLVADPLDAIATLPLQPEQRRRLAYGYAALTERLPTLYADLPQQLVHEDYAPSNVLSDGERVTGVLDFEFCARDLRVMDMTVALSWWPEAQFGTGTEWPILDAFAHGYFQHITLSPDELAAVPTLFSLRAYSSLLHRLGRQRAGLSTQAAVIARAEAALQREDWLAASGQRLIDTLERCLQSR